MNITGEMIERAAKAYVDALYGDIRAAGYEPEWSWETWEEEKRERERRRIRKALEAALEGIDIMAHVDKALHAALSSIRPGWPADLWTLHGIGMRKAREALEDSKQ